MKRRKLLVLDSLGYDPVYDGMSVAYTLRRPATTTLWTNAVFKVRRDSDNATAFVFFDGDSPNDTISMSSLISTSSRTTPDATVFIDWIGTDVGYVEEWIGITDDDTVDTNKIASQTNTALQPIVANAGGLIMKEGTPYVIFPLGATQYLETPAAISALDGSNDWTIYFVCHGGDNAYLAVAATSNNSANRIELSADRSVANWLGTVRSGGTNTPINLAATDTTSDDRYLIMQKDGTTYTGYRDNVLVDTETNGTAYDNNTLIIGAGQQYTNPLAGGVKEIIIFPEAQI